MKTLLCYLLTVTILLGTLVTPIFATSPEGFEQTELHNDDHLQTSDFIDETIISPSNAIRVENIRINETAESFLNKIGTNILSINAAIVDDSKNTSTAASCFQTMNRFQITDIAYEKGILSDSQRMEAYCIIFENRLFKNIPCLTPIVEQIKLYQEQNTVSEILDQRIQSIVASPTEILTSAAQSLRSTESLNTYESTNFTFRYDSGITASMAASAANIFENARLALTGQQGFRQPLLTNGQQKYLVYLYSTPDSEYPEDTTISGITNITSGTNPTFATEISIYNFTACDSFAAQVMVHEYFHAIQAAYYRWDYTWFAPYISWLMETTATWIAIDHVGQSTYYNPLINDYLASTYGITEHVYGSVLYFYALNSFSGASGNTMIKSIWEKFATYSIRIEYLDELKDYVLDPVLSSINESFDSVFERMLVYNHNPAYWYQTYHPGGATAVAAWTENNTTTVTTTARSQTAAFTDACSRFTVSELSQHYFDFVPDLPGQNSKLRITVDFTESSEPIPDNAVVKYCYQNSAGNYVFGNFTKTAPNSYSYSTTDYGATINKLSVMISSLSEAGDDIDKLCTVKYHVERGTQESVSILASSRYQELIHTVGKGEYREYLMTFGSSGTRLLQTFGGLATRITIYDSNRNQLATNTGSGYLSRNALLSYYFSSGSSYYVRVEPASSVQSGTLKLTIMPSASYSSFSGFTTKTNNTASVSGSLTSTSGNIYVYKFSSSRDVTVNISATNDTYLYIIDPRSVLPMEAADNTTPTNTKGKPCLYNDDYSGTRQSQITKTFSTNVPYIIIVIKYNPGSTTNGTYTMSFT